MFQSIPWEWTEIKWKKTTLKQCFGSWCGLSLDSKGSGQSFRPSKGKNKERAWTSILMFKKTCTIVFDQNFFAIVNFFQFFKLKILIWLWIRIPIRSGFNNSLDPDPDSLSPDPKHCVNYVLFGLFCISKNKGAKLSHCWMLRRHNQKIEDEKKHQMVPFREAKLTRLIKTFFRQSQHGF